MNFVIKALTPELTADFFDFFDNRAFTDHEEWSFCYCTFFHMDKEHEQRVEEEVKANSGKDALRNCLKNTAVAFLKENTLQGYLAYIQGVPVGWCNANDKSAYSRFDFNPEVSEFIRTYSNDKTKTVACFTIAPEYRGRGLATALLERVVSDAGAEGYAFVEVYPRLHDIREPFDYNGPVRLYKKAGFAEVARKGKVIIMRKEPEKQP
ncbi:MAG: GNAT family N-acetyltransferase [Clostridia bacterium]